jgi:hypothetical protein
MIRRVLLFALLLVPVAGCSRNPSSGMPEEFPPVHLGMSYADAREALVKDHGTVTEQSPSGSMLRVTGRDRRVAEETFLFYEGALAAWTARFPTAASRGNFMRETKRFTMAFGEPFESHDDGAVLLARWRLPDRSGRVLLSGFIAGRGPEHALMVRVEDPSVVKRLVRSLARDGSESPSDTAQSAPDSSGT